MHMRLPNYIKRELGYGMTHAFWWNTSNQDIRCYSTILGCGFFWESLSVDSMDLNGDTCISIWWCRNQEWKKWKSIKGQWPKAQALSWRACEPIHFHHLANLEWHELSQDSDSKQELPTTQPCLFVLKKKEKNKYDPKKVWRPKEVELNWSMNQRKINH